MAKKYYWLKLKDDFFNQREIKKLRKIAGGDTYTIIYLKLQLLSLKNEARLIFDETEESLHEQLSLEIDEDEGNVGIVIGFLQRNKLLEIINEKEYFLTKASENIGTEGDSAERVRKYREKKALQCNTKKLLSNSKVTKCNTEIERREDIYIYIDEDEDKEGELCKQKSASSSNVFKFYQKNFGPITEFVAQDIGHFLNDGVEEKLIIKALEIALEKNVLNWKYAKAILLKKFAEGIKTLEQFEASEIKFKKTAEIKKQTNFNAVSNMDNFEQRDVPVEGYDKYIYKVEGE